MLKKTLTYIDYNGVSRTEDYYFNLTQAEVIKWLMTSGDYTLDQVLIRLSEERNGKEIIRIFEELLHFSYGRKSLDGTMFEKNEELWKRFSQTEAYSNLFMELVTDGAKAAAFINAVIPHDLAESVAKVMAENPEGIPAELRDYIGPVPVLPGA